MSSLARIMNCTAEVHKRDILAFRHSAASYANPYGNRSVPGGFFVQRVVPKAPAAQATRRGTCRSLASAAATPEPPASWYSASSLTFHTS